MDTINKRIEKIVNESGLTKTAFAKQLNVSQQYISKLIKTGEPSELFKDALCSSFNINRDWLETGEGDMSLEVPIEDEYFKAATMISKENDRDAMDAIVKYWKLDSDSKKAIWKFLHSLAEK